MANKIQFRTQFTGDTAKYTTECGTPFLDEYALKYDDNGKCTLEKTGEQKNVQAMIDADYPATDINMIMQRFALGDDTALKKVEGFYGDFTTMPTSMAELYQRAEDSKRFFEELPVEVKQMFNNSYSEFWSEMTNDVKSFNDKISKYNESAVIEPVKDEPVKDEPKGDE